MPLVMDLASLKTAVASVSLVAAFPPTIDVTSASGVSNVTGSVADPGSGIWCLFDPWIRDPGWVESQHPDPGSGVNNPDQIF